MNKLFFLLTFLILIYSSSCEKTANSSMSCPDLIQNVSLSDFPMDMYGINEISLVEDELFINVNYGGEEIEIGFNSKYILEMINSLEDETIILDFKDSASPVIAKEESNPNLVYVLMPMRV